MGQRRSLTAIVVVLLLVSAPRLHLGAAAREKIFRKALSVTTRDGIVLPAVYFRPARVGGNLPVVVLPHGGGDRGECEWYIEKARRYADRGYVSIIYTARGHGRFPGLLPRPCPADGRVSTDPGDTFDAFGPKTLADLYDVIHAVVRDNDSHADRDTVGIHGYSQGGATTNLGAAWEHAQIQDRGPGATMVEINPYGIDVDAIGPAHSFYGLYRSLAPNECVKESFGLGLLAGYYGSGAVVDPYLTGRWTAALASGEPTLKDSIKPEMALRSPETYKRAFTVPSFWVQAFDDLLFPADEAVKAFEDGAIDRLWLSWGGHAAPASNVSEKELSARERTWDFWFDRFLKHERNGIDDQARVTYWFHDPDKHRLQHRATSGTWPPRRADDVAMYLASEDRLVSSPPRAAGEHALANVPGMQSLGADPIVASMPFGSSLPPGARTPLETATFTSKKFKEPTLLAGDPSLKLFWRSTGTEFQTNALLWDVYPDGTRWLISRGCKLHENTTPGQQRAVKLDLFHSARLLAPGHRLELWVSPVDQPSFLASKEPSENWLYFSKRLPSRLEIPLIDWGG